MRNILCIVHFFNFGMYSFAVLSPFLLGFTLLICLSINIEWIMILEMNINLKNAREGQFDTPLWFFENCIF